MVLQEPTKTIMVKAADTKSSNLLKSAGAFESNCAPILEASGRAGIPRLMLSKSLPSAVPAPRSVRFQLDHERPLSATGNIHSPPPSNDAASQLTVSMSSLSVPVARADDIAQSADHSHQSPLQLQKDLHLFFDGQPRATVANLSGDNEPIGSLDGAALTREDMQLSAEDGSMHASAPSDWPGSMDVETVPEVCSAQSAVLSLQEVPDPNQAGCKQDESQPGRIASIIGNFKSRFNLAEIQLAYAGHQIRKCRDQAAG